MSYVVGHEGEVSVLRVADARLGMVASDGNPGWRLLDVAIQPIDTYRGRVYKDANGPALQLLQYAYTWRSVSAALPGWTLSGRRPGDPAPAAVRRFQNG